MKFCSQCGQSVILKTPDDDNRPRFVCDACETIHYQNPKIVAGCLPVWEDKVLLCRRAIEPRHGFWTLPAGFMENDETVQQAATRETTEEANARVRLQELYTIFNLPHVSQVYMIFRSQLLDLDFSPGIESLETRLFSEDQIPWDEMAFKTIEQTLHCFFEDRKNNTYRPHLGDIICSSENTVYVPHT
jgi:ADP-ribose pyrophosphatase YjhB (NUDIX family)